MTVAAAFRQIVDSLSTVYSRGEAGSIARIVLEDAFGIRNVNREDHLSAHQLYQLAAIESRLLEHEPVQYILGQADFYGLKFKVTPAVLIPRPETEELVHWLLEDWDGAEGKKKTTLLDIGTGSGCIPVTIKKKRPQWTVTGVDICIEALNVARENGAQNDVEVNWLRMDILDRAQWKELGAFDIIVSNPPYIPENERGLMPENVSRFEPEQALFVKGSDPLLFYQAIASFALTHLLSNGALYFEINEYHSGEVVNLLNSLSFRNVELRRDLQGKFRMIKALKGN